MIRHAVCIASKSYLFQGSANNIIMEFRKKHIIFTAIFALVIVVNFLSTLRLFFAIRYPEREIREVITEFFKNNLNKAVKCDDIYIDYSGEIQISNFNMSIASDFNDNISLIKCKTAVINLDFFNLFAGRIKIKGLGFYNSETTFPKKYGRSHVDSFNQILDIPKFLKRAGNSYINLYIYFKRATLHYNESLRDKQVYVELYKTDAEFYIESNSVSYRIDGYIKPYKSERIRRGSFYCKGEFDLPRANIWSHRIKIDNFDLTYLNNYIQEYKISDVSLSGGLSCDLEISMKNNVQVLKGQVETNNLKVTDIIKKFNIVSNENLNVEMELIRDTKLNSYTVPRLNLYDDIFSIQASGKYVRNQKDEKLNFQFKTNRIDLADLSRNLTPYNNIGYTGTINSSGKFYLDIKNNRATGSKANLRASKFTLVNNEKGNEKTIIGESNINIKLTESEIAVDATMNPLSSDLSLKSRTLVSNWIPFRSDSQITLASQRFNSEILFHTIKYLLSKLLATAYENRKIIDDTMSFLQKPAGKFLNSNNIILKCNFDSIFFGKNTKLKNFVFDMQLNRGILFLKEFAVNGYEAEYRMAAQAFFNSDQPYIKLEGKINELNLAEFFRGTGLKGFVSGKANIDYKYELSANRLSDILENSRGNLNIYITKGILKNTALQNNFIKFLQTNGHSSVSIKTINFETLSLSISQLGEHFWFTNFGIRGDTLTFNGVGDYTYPSGMSSHFGVTVKDEEAAIVIPIQLYGPLLAPCIDYYNKKDSQKTCF
jgi:hypothetical protein